MAEALPNWLNTVPQADGIQTSTAITSSSAIPKRPSARPPSVKIQTRRVKLNKRFFFQLINIDGDSFYSDLDTGESYWLLPDGNPVSRVRYITHVSDKGLPYYESLKTKEVVWTIPTEALSKKALPIIKMLTKMNRAQCTTMIHDTFNEDAMTALLQQLDDYAADLDEGKKNLSESEEEVEDHVIGNNADADDATANSTDAGEGAKSLNMPLTPGTPATPVPPSEGGAQGAAVSATAGGQTPGTPMGSPMPPPHATTASVGGVDTNKVSTPAPADAIGDDTDASDVEDHTLTGDDPNATTLSEEEEKESAEIIKRKDEEDNSFPIQGLMSGFMEKQPVTKKTAVQNENGGTWKRRYFVLSPLVLTYYQDYTDERMITKGKVQGEVQIFPHTMVQKCAAESHSGGHEFIFRLLNSLTGESIRIACASDATRERWMQSILNCANNLQSRGFMAETFGSYAGMLRGYTKKYFVFSGTSLHQFSNEKAITDEEAFMSINKKTKLERVEENKGRLVLINATGSDGHAKYQLQFDTTGGAKSQFYRWLTAFQNKINASTKEDESELRDHNIFSANANVKAYNSDNESDGSDVQMNVDGIRDSNKGKGEPSIKKTSLHSESVLGHSHDEPVSTPVLSTPSTSGAAAAAAIVVPVGADTLTPTPLTLSSTAAPIGTEHHTHTKPKNTATTSHNHHNSFASLKPGEAPHRPSAGPPPASHVPVPVSVPEHVPAPVPVADTNEGESISVPVTAVQSEEIHALMERLKQLEQDRQAAQEKEEAAKARKALKKAAKKARKVTVMKAGTETYLKDIETTITFASDSVTSPVIQQPATEKKLTKEEIALKATRTKAYLNQMYGEDTDSSSPVGSTGKKSRDEKEDEDEDVNEEHRDTLGGLSGGSHSHHGKHGHGHHSHHGSSHHSSYDSTHHSDAHTSTSHSHSSPKGPKRSSIWSAPISPNILINSDKDAAAKIELEEKFNKPFARQLFDKYSEFDSDRRFEMVINAHGLQRLQYDHGYYVNLGAVLKSARGIGQITEHTTFAAATLNYEEFLIWYRIAGQILVELKASYSNKAITGVSGNGDVAVSFYSRLKMCMIFRIHEETEHHLKGSLDRKHFAKLHEYLLDEALILDEYHHSDMNGSDSPITVQQSWDQVLNIADHARKDKPHRAPQGTRISTDEDIMLEDYVTWITEFCTEQLSNKAPEGPPKGFASKTRNLLRGVFGFTKPIKTVSSGAASMAALNSIHEKVSGTSGSGSPDRGRGGGQHSSHHDNNTHHPHSEHGHGHHHHNHNHNNNHHGHNHNHPHEDKRDGMGNDYQSDSATKPTVFDENTVKTSTNMYTKALSRYTNIGDDEKDNDNDDDDDDDDSSSDETTTTEETANAHHAALAGENLLIGHVDDWAELLEKKHKNIKDDPDFVNCGVSDVTSVASNGTDKDKNKQLPTSEDLWHDTNGPRHSIHLEDDDYKSLNETHHNTKDSKVLASAFANAFGNSGKSDDGDGDDNKGGSISTTAAAAPPPPPPVSVTVPVPPPAPEKPMSALEKMALANKNKKTISASLPPSSSTRSISLGSSPAVVKPLTLKEKMAAAVEAKRKKTLAGSLNASTLVAAKQNAAAAAVSESRPASMGGASSSSSNAAPFVSAAAISSNKDQTTESEVSINKQSQSQPQSIMNCKSESTNALGGEEADTGIATTVGVGTGGRKLTINNSIVANNKVSWDTPQSSPASDSAVTSIYEPTYNNIMDFDEYGVGVAPLETPMRSKHHNHHHNAMGSKNKSNSNSSSSSSNTNTLRQQEKTTFGMMNKNKTTGTGTGAAGFFKPSQRKKIAPFKSQMPEDKDTTSNSEVQATTLEQTTEVDAASVTALKPVVSTVTSISPPRIISSTEQSLLAQLGLTDLPVSHGEAWETKLDITPSAITVEAPLVTSISNNAGGEGSGKVAAATSSSQMSSLFIPRAQPASPSLTSNTGTILSFSGTGENATPPPPPRGRRSSVNVFASASGNTKTATRAVQTGNSEIGQCYVVVGFAEKHKHKHKYSKHVEALKLHSQSSEQQALIESTALESTIDQDDNNNSHVPKSAFHLILGERYAVDDMWLRVREEEAKSIAEIEVAEAAAAKRIHKEELNSLRKVQYAWAQRDIWHKGASKELNLLITDLDENASELDKRRNISATVHKQCSSDIQAAYKQLLTHHTAITKEKLRIHAKKIRSEMDNCLMNLTIQDAQQELYLLLHRSKDIHKKHIELDQGAAAARQKRLPHYMQHNDENDAFIAALQAGGISGLGVGVGVIGDIKGYGAEKRNSTTSSSQRLQFNNSRNANSVDKEVTFHKYDGNSVKLAIHTPSQAKESRRRSLSASGMGGPNAENKGDLNFRTAEHESHLAKYRELYVNTPHEAQLKVPTRTSIHDQTPAQCLLAMKDIEAAADVAANESIEQRKKYGSLRMAQRPSSKGAKSGGFLKRGAGTGGTAGKGKAQDWHPVETTVLVKTNANPMIASAVVIANDRATKALAAKQASRKILNTGAKTTNIITQGGGNTAYKQAFAKDVYSGLDTKIDVRKDYHGHYEIGHLVTGDKYVPLHSRSPSKSPTRFPGGQGQSLQSSSPREAERAEEAGSPKKALDMSQYSYASNFSPVNKSATAAALAAAALATGALSMKGAGGGVIEAVDMSVFPSTSKE